MRNRNGGKEKIERGKRADKTGKRTAGTDFRRTVLGLRKAGFIPPSVMPSLSVSARLQEKGASRSLCNVLHKMREPLDANCPPDVKVIREGKRL